MQKPDINQAMYTYLQLSKNLVEAIEENMNESIYCQNEDAVELILALVIGLKSLEVELERSIAKSNEPTLVCY